MFHFAVKTITRVPMCDAATSSAFCLNWHQPDVSIFVLQRPFPVCHPPLLALPRVHWNLSHQRRSQAFTHLHAEFRELAARTHSGQVAIVFASAFQLWNCQTQVNLAPVENPRGANPTPSEAWSWSDAKQTATTIYTNASFINGVCNGDTFYLNENWKWRRGYKNAKKRNQMECWVISSYNLKRVSVAEMMSYCQGLTPPKFSVGDLGAFWSNIVCN